ncbi:MAG: S1C family serine protease [Patescibacteria group bacterium]
MKINKFLVTISLSVFFGLVAGVVGGMVARGYLLDNIPFFGEIDFSRGYNNQGIIIRDGKKVVVEQNTKVIEAIDLASASLVGIFKKQLLAKSKAGANFNLNNYYQLDQNIGQGLIITSDGWIVTNFQIEAGIKATDYAIITKDKKIYSVDKIIKDNLTTFSFIHVVAKDLPVRKFVDDSDIKNGNLIIALNWQRDSLLSTIVSKQSKNNKLVNSSDSLFGEIILDSKLSQEFSKAILFNLAGDTLALVDGKGVIRPINQLTGAVNSLLKRKEINRPSLGINYIDLANLILIDVNNANYLKKGVVISKDSDGIAVIKNSPAYLAGFKAGDIIISVNNIELDENNNLAKIIQQYIAGDKINIEYWSQGEKKQVDVILGQLK